VAYSLTILARSLWEVAMKLALPLFTLLLGYSIAAAPPNLAWAQAPTYSDELVEEFSQIVEGRAAFVDSYATGDLDGIVGAYHEEATFAGTLQPFWLEGVEEIRDMWGRYFNAWPERRLIFRQPVVRFYNDAASVETGYIEMHMGGDEKKTVSTYIRYSITRAKTDEGWKIVNMHVSRLPSVEQGY
jgi:uncharacterized protein (TIGR02246 family)